jgi:transcriptional regulator with XRE-family HTH domain
VSESHLERERGRKLLSQNLRRLRLKKGLSQEQLGFQADVDRTHIARIETKAVNFTVEILFSLATALEVDPRQLLLPEVEWTDAEREHTK